MAAACFGHDGWVGRLALDFQRRGHGTTLVRRRHVGPLTVQRAFQPEPGVCHTYVIHPPGGVAGGDRLDMDVNVGDCGHALLTTPAAGKFYRTAGAPAEQLQGFRAGPGARVEWLPMETILHGGSDVALTTRFDLEADAGLLTWDILCLGRPGSGDHFERGRCRQRIRVDVDGAPVLDEQLRLEAGDPLLTAPWGLAGNPAVAALLAYPADERAAEWARAALGGELRAGVTLLDGLLVCRVLGPGAEAVRTVLERVWARLRPDVLGVTPCPPRIWTT